MPCGLRNSRVAVSGLSVTTFGHKEGKAFMTTNAGASASNSSGVSGTALYASAFFRAGREHAACDTSTSFEVGRSRLFARSPSTHRVSAFCPALWPPR